MAQEIRNFLREWRQGNILLCRSEKKKQSIAVRQQKWRTDNIALVVSI